MINTKSWEGGTDEEYATQHFGFGSQLFKISVRQMIEQTITNNIKNMESFMLTKLRLNDTDKSTLTGSCDKLIRLYCERAEPSMDAIDAEIERMLKIPANVLLPEDEEQLEQTSDEDYEKLKEEVAALRKRVERGALMEALLTAEDEELTSVEKVYEVAQKDMDVLDMMHMSLEKNDQAIKTIQNKINNLCETIPFLENSDNDLLNEE